MGQLKTLLESALTHSAVLYPISHARVCLYRIIKRKRSKNAIEIEGSERKERKNDEEKI